MAVAVVAVVEEEEGNGNETYHTNLALEIVMLLGPN